MAKGIVVSFNPEDAVSGGVLEEGDYEFSDAQFIMFDYGGKSESGPVPALSVKMTDLKSQDEVEQVWSAGSGYVPSEDGMSLVGAIPGIKKKTNLYALFVSLVEADFPLAELNKHDISVLNGLKAHMIRKPGAAAEIYKTRPEGEQGKGGDRTVPVVGEILELPGGKKDGKKSGGGKKAADKPAAKGGKDGVTKKATSTLMGLLKDNPSIAQSDLAGIAFEALADDDDRNAVLKVMFDENFLKDGPWNFADGTITAL